MPAYITVQPISSRLPITGSSRNGAAPPSSLWIIALRVLFRTCQTVPCLAHPFELLGTVRVSSGVYRVFFCVRLQGIVGKFADCIPIIPEWRHRAVALTFEASQSAVPGAET